MPLLLLCAAQFVVVLDVTIVAVALPDIRGSLGFSTEGLQWVVTAYTLSFGGLLIGAGRLGGPPGGGRGFRPRPGPFGAAAPAGAPGPRAGAPAAPRGGG